MFSTYIETQSAHTQENDSAPPTFVYPTVIPFKRQGLLSADLKTLTLNWGVQIYTVFELIYKAGVTVIEKWIYGYQKGQGGKEKLVVWD